MEIERKNDQAPTIRRGTSEDRAQLVEHYQRIAASDAPYYPMPADRDRIAEWLQRAGYLDLAKNFHWLAVAGGRLAGDFFVKRVELPSIGLRGIAEAYLTVDGDFRRAGVGMALMSALPAAMHETLAAAGVRRLVCHVFRENGPAIKLVTATGWKFEGILEQHMLGRDGEYHDNLIFAYMLGNSSSGRPAAPAAGGC